MSPEERQTRFVNAGSSEKEASSDKVLTRFNDMEKCEAETSIHATDSSSASTPHPDGTAQGLKSIPGSLPWTARALMVWLILQYGADSSVPTGNYMIFPLPQGGNGAGAPPAGSQETAGALGLGLKTATTIGTAYSFIFPVFSVVCAWLADVTFTRLQIIRSSAIMGCLYLALLLIASLPSVISDGHAAIPFMIGLAVKNITRGELGSFWS
jgi:hypothetical protein